jgi:carbonic anhydrase
MKNDMKVLMNELSSKQAIDRLKEGNRRFTSGVRAVEPLLSHLRMKELAEKGQKPFAIVLTCSDSRSPVEMIFDQGLGDLFVIRVAGNVVAASLLASIEFAAANFGSPTVLVLGHTQCGAVKATIDYARDPSQSLPSPHLEELIGRIRPAVDHLLHDCSIDHPDFVSLSIRENVLRSMRLIQEQSRIISSLVAQGSITVEGAILDIATGQVDFME